MSRKVIPAAFSFKMGTRMWADIIVNALLLIIWFLVRRERIKAENELKNLLRWRDST